MIRIVCPFCHTALKPSELDVAFSSTGAFLICPECDQVMASEGHAPDESAATSRADLVNA